ncbi:hypothetical protein QYF36_006897 [Acer negundo]|nr:hypothetical protein QYF36_006897 [Acer negundo]
MQNAAPNSICTPVSSASVSIPYTVSAQPFHIDISPPSISPTPHISQPTNIHPMVTRSRTGCLKPKVFTALHQSELDSINIEPKSVSDALARPHWKHAMVEDPFDQLAGNVRDNSQLQTKEAENISVTPTSGGFATMLVFPSTAHNRSQVTQKTIIDHDDQNCDHHEYHS